MVAFIRLILVLFALTSFVVSANAQLVWSIAHSDWHMGHTGHLDSNFEFSAISSFGSNCTLGASVTDTTIHPIVKHYFFYRSSDNGANWYRQMPNISNPISFGSRDFIQIQQIDSLNIVAIGDSGFILRTFDAGNSWSRQQSSIVVAMKAIHFSDPLYGIACSDNKEIITTSDGGKNWNLQPVNIFADNCYSYGKGKFRIIGSRLKKVYTTTDNFQTLDSIETNFNKANDPHNTQYVLAFTSLCGDTIVAYGRVFDDSIAVAGIGLIMRSTNGGKDWGNPFFNYNLTQISQSTQIDRDTIIAGGIGFPSIMISTDRGASWSEDSLRLDTTYGGYFLTNNLAMTGDGHPIGTYLGVVIKGSWQTASVNINPETVVLNQQIYPNPSSGFVTINAKTGANPVGIYDFLGRDILRGMFSETGTVTLNLSSQPTGIYSIVLFERTRTIPLGKVLITR
jgi:photosystem II stability/assembly factor-like uncharacterized protein